MAAETLYLTKLLPQCFWDEVYRVVVTIVTKDSHAPGVVFDLEDCRIAREPVMALWARVRDQRGLLPQRIDSLGKGQFLGVQRSKLCQTARKFHSPRIRFSSNVKTREQAAEAIAELEKAWT